MLNNYITAWGCGMWWADMEISRGWMYSTIFKVILGSGLFPKHPGPLAHLPQFDHLLAPTGQDMTSQVSTLSLVQSGKALPVTLSVSTPGRGNLLCFSVPLISFLLFKVLLTRWINENEHLEHFCHLAFCMFYDVLTVKQKMSSFFIYLNTMIAALEIVLHCWCRAWGWAGGGYYTVGGSMWVLDVVRSAWMSIPAVYCLCDPEQVIQSCQTSATLSVWWGSHHILEGFQKD